MFTTSNKKQIGFEFVDLSRSTLPSHRRGDLRYVGDLDCCSEPRDLSVDSLAIISTGAFRQGRSCKGVLLLPNAKKNHLPVCKILLSMSGLRITLFTRDPLQFLEEECRACWQCLVPQIHIYPGTAYASHCFTIFVWYDEGFLLFFFSEGRCLTDLALGTSMLNSKRCLTLLCRFIGIEKASLKLQAVQDFHL